MTYRNAIQSDFAEMQRLCAKAYDREHALLQMGKLLRAPFVLLAQTGTAIVGFGILAGDKIDLLYIDDAYRPIGIATELHAKLENIARNTTTEAASISDAAFF